MATSIRTRKIIPLLAGISLAVSLGLWWWTSGICYRPLPSPAIAMRHPFALLQACADDDGIHFLAVKNSRLQFPAVWFGRASYLGNAGYHHALVVNLLGVVIGVLPTTYHDGDMIVSPYAALVLPYWLLIVASGAALVVTTPLAAWLSRYWRPTRMSAGAAALVCGLFLVLNVIPSAWRPGALIQPQTFREWAMLIVEPEVEYSDIMLEYGFPFCYYRRGIIDGETADSYHGASVGWLPHKFMENACLAALSAFAVVLGAQWLRQRAANSAALQANEPEAGQGLTADPASATPNA
jgi:hypothetical protein